MKRKGSGPRGKMPTVLGKERVGHSMRFALSLVAGREQGDGLPFVAYGYALRSARLQMSVFHRLERWDLVSLVWTRAPRAYHDGGSAEVRLTEKGRALLALWDLEDAAWVRARTGA